ncbi:hypothetical protein ON010_g16563 [Phytophthora cinnamomi]|nr:hypothetical protein ON010_g16563 [Phytophthora cinnamomi]
MVSIRSALTFACVALVASVSATSDEHRTLQAVNFRSDLLDAINAVRKTEGLKPMCINEMLMDSAQNQANDMADGNFIKSTGSDGSTPKQRAAVEGFKAAEVTEVRQEHAAQQAQRHGPWLHVRQDSEVRALLGRRLRHRRVR